MQGEPCGMRDGEQPLSIGRDERVVVRLLHEQERPYSTPERSAPLVVEHPEHARADLRGVLREYSPALRASLVKHGALLFRGFAVGTAAQLESALAGLTWAEAMNGYFMAEPGRALDPGAQHVFHTNTLFKTGGSFSVPGDGFHSENYYSTDIPRFQAFWCARAPWLGGETAFCVMARAFASLNIATRHALEQIPTCFPRAWTLQSVAQRYHVSLVRLREIIDELQLRRQEVDGEEWLILEKPSIVRHPTTGLPSLQVNISREVPGLTAELNALFRSNYRGSRWALHRAAWSGRNVRRVFEAAEDAIGFVCEPRDGARAFLGRRQLTKHARNQSSQPIPRERRLGYYLAPSVVAELARGMWNHSCVFSWRRGDVLLLDNFQVLHAGMPGFGPRQLRVMLLNPTPSAGATADGALHARLCREASGCR